MGLRLFLLELNNPINYSQFMLSSILFYPPLWVWVVVIAFLIYLFLMWNHEE